MGLLVVLTTVKTGEKCVPERERGMMGDVQGKRHEEGKRGRLIDILSPLFQQVRSGINGLAWLVMVKIHPLSFSHSLHLSVSETDLHIHTDSHPSFTYVLFFLTTPAPTHTSMFLPTFCLILYSHHIPSLS